MAKALLVTLQSQLFGLPVEHVAEMVTMPPVSRLPHAPEHVRGLINLRGRVLAVSDLRRRLGMPSLGAEVDELDALLVQRETDHRHWVEELSAAVREGREFGLATDPHECAFGKWYRGFKTDNVALAFQLKKFEEPHARLHGVAESILALGRAGRQDEAQQAIQRSRDAELGDLIRLFAETREALRDTHREVAVVLDDRGRQFAVAVDAVDRVEELADEGEGELPPGIDTDLIAGLRKSPRDQSLVMLLAPERLLEWSGAEEPTPE